MASHIVGCTTPGPLDKRTAATQQPGQAELTQVQGEGLLHKAGSLGECAGAQQVQGHAVARPELRLQGLGTLGNEGFDPVLAVPLIVHHDAVPCTLSSLSNGETPLVHLQKWLAGIPCWEVYLESAG